MVKRKAAVSAKDNPPAQKSRAVATTKVAMKVREPKTVVYQEIEDGVVAILSAKQFILPRAMPTHVVSVCTRQVVNLNGVDTAIVTALPHLLTPMTISTTLAAVSNGYAYIPATYAGISEQFEELFNLAPNLQLCLALDLKNGSSVMPQRPIPSAFSGVVIFTQNDSADFSQPMQQLIAYEGTVSSMSGNFKVDHIASPTSTTCSLQNFTVRFWAGSTQLSSVVITPTITGNQAVFNLASVTIPAGNDAFSFECRLPNNQITLPLQFELGSAIITVSTIPLIRREFAPIDGDTWAPLVNTASNWSVTAMSLTCTSTTSQLNNGGNFSIALLPTGINPIGTTASQVYDYLAERPFNSHVGALFKGGHTSFLADDISQYFFKDIGIQTYPAPKLMAALIKGADVVFPMSFVITLDMCYEFICSDVTRPSVVCPSHAAYFESLVGAIIRAYMTDPSGTGLSSENPQHMTKIKSFAKKVAKDPRIQSMAKDLMHYGVSSAKKYGPMLLGGLL